MTEFFTHLFSYEVIAMQGNVFEKEISEHKANICMDCDFSCEYGMEWTSVGMEIAVCVLQ